MAMMKQILQPRGKNRYLVEIYPNGAINVPSVITDMVAKVSGGGVTVDALERHYLNHQKEFANGVKFTDLTIVFQPSESPDYDNFIKEYLKLLKDPETGEMRPQSDLDVDMTVILLSREGKEITRWQYQGCWLKEWDGIDGDYSDKTSPTESSTTWSVEQIK